MARRERGVASELVDAAALDQESVVDGAVDRSLCGAWTAAELGDQRVVKLGEPPRLRPAGDGEELIVCECASSLRPVVKQGEG
jgi:hypothetical protein